MHCVAFTDEYGSYIGKTDIEQVRCFIDGSYDMGQILGIQDNLENQTDFRAMVGRIGWLANNSRPDLCYDSIALSTKVGKATLADLKQAGKIMRKVKTESTEMKFLNLGPVEKWTIEGHGDAGYISLPDKVSSCGGQVIVISNRKERK